MGTQSISFQGSVFTNNEQRDPPALFTYGVITVTSENNALIIDDCEFTDNTYDEDFGVSVERNVWRLPDYLQRSQSFFFFGKPGSYVIRSFGGPVEVTGSTFCGNSVNGFGLVEIFSYEEDVVASNNGGSVDSNLTCSFIAVSDTIPEEDRQVTCIAFDADGCDGNTDAPSMSPVVEVSPSQSPTTSPSLSPTVSPSTPPVASSSPSPTTGSSTDPTASPFMPPVASTSQPPTTGSSPYPTAATSKSSVAKTEKSLKTHMKKMMNGKGTSSKGKSSSSTKGSSMSGKGKTSKSYSSKGSKGMAPFMSKGSSSASKESSSRGSSSKVSSVGKLMKVKMLMRGKYWEDQDRK